jgi:glyoxylase I family protein
VTADQFTAAKKKLDEAGTEYLGPDRGVDNSMYFRDPNGVGLELYREDLGRFEGEVLVD